MDKQEFSEEEIKTLFEGVEETIDHPSLKNQNSAEPDQIHYEKAVVKQPNSKVKEWTLNAVKTLGIFIGIFTFTFVLLNFPALFIKTKYFVKVETKTNPVQVVDPMLAYMQAKDNYLFIPKIDVESPISWNIPDDQTLPALEKGVAHYLNTALPGQNGNIFISGHSSNFWWDKGSYNQIFALLDKLTPGDKIYINYGGHIHKYMVTDKKVINPKNLSVLDQTQNRTLSLMTCVPIGTNLNRLIVSALEVN